MSRVDTGVSRSLLQSSGVGTLKTFHSSSLVGCTVVMFDSFLSLVLGKSLKCICESLG